MSLAVTEIVNAMPLSRLSELLDADQQELSTAAAALSSAVLNELAEKARGEGEQAVAQLLSSQLASGVLDPASGEVDLTKLSPAGDPALVAEVFGSPVDQVAQSIAGAISGADQQLVAALLPIVTPVTLCYLADRLGRTATTDGEQTLLLAILGGELCESISTSEGLSNAGQDLCLADLLGAMANASAADVDREPAADDAVAKLLARIFR